jgi:hypothetical protein
MTTPSSRTMIVSAAVFLVVIQFVPINHDNPLATGSLAAPASVAPILRRSCSDCHSHETTWPWYSYVAPVSWLVANDVHEGRRHLNLSNWSGYSVADQQKKLLEISDETKEGGMPLWYYTPLHPAARLSQADVDALVGWAESSSAQLAGKR